VHHESDRLGGRERGHVRIGRKSRLIVLLAFGIAGLGALVSNARAQEYSVYHSESGLAGPYHVSYSYCNRGSYDTGNTVTVRAPMVAAVDARPNLRDAQWVSWQPLLFRIDGPTPVQVQAGRSTERFAWVTDADFDAAFADVTETFPWLPAGAYKVVLLMKWYASSTVPRDGVAVAVPAMAYAIGKPYPNDPAFCDLR
jgi:hypothetical protein